MKIVLAANYQRYRYWLRENKLTERDAVYIDREEKLLGLELSPSDIVDLGGWNGDRALLATRIRKPRPNASPS